VQKHSETIKGNKMKTEYKPCEFTFIYKGVDGESLTKHFRTSDGATWQEPLAGFQMFLSGIGYQFEVGSVFDLVSPDEDCNFDCTTCDEDPQKDLFIEPKADTTPYWISRFVDEELNDTFRKEQA
jgi:hypothetical protein